MNNSIRRNERDWAGQLISWIKSAIDKKATVFQDVTNDTGVKLESGRTKFPDILLFTDKISGVIFNGWELKFPDTAVDDPTMLENALEKAKKLKSESFVTWNGAEAVIWKIDTDHYTAETLVKLKHYPKVPTINNRGDLSDPVSYARHESLLRDRAMEILHDLDQLYRNNELRPAINVSGTIIAAIASAYLLIVPQFADAIKVKRGADKTFREQFHEWEIYESATLKILGSSSRRVEKITPEDILAKFTFYNLIGKIIFYLTLSENLSGELPELVIHGNNVRSELGRYFDKAKGIDYQAIFQPYFTDNLEYSSTTEKALRQLINTLTEFDFKLLPTEVIGTILENVVPSEEKQKLGQYFTPGILADIVAFPAVAGRDSLLFDPTSGTGTFLNSFYNILKYYGNASHQDRLDQIWGNDISHFPAILSVINLYKQDVTQTDNFPRVIRDDFFNLHVGDSISFPDPNDHSRHHNVSIPQFDGIASNFPFVQQEDIPNEKLSSFFKSQFEFEQSAFVREGNFKINERADYFTYCIYNSFRFLKDGGVISGITSNAWLGKDYGIQFKDFLLNNFHIKYVVKSNAGHWFSDSLVSTVFLVLEKGQSDRPTRFVTFNSKLKDMFKGLDMKQTFEKIEKLYSEIDNCDNPRNKEWSQDPVLKELYYSADGNLNVAVIQRDRLVKSIADKTNWAQFFISSDLFEKFDSNLIQYHNHIVNVIRGERAGWNPMFVIPEKEIAASGIAPQFLKPYIKTPTEFETIEFEGNYNCKAFVCDKPMDRLDRGTQNWIKKFEHVKNKNGKAYLPDTCKDHKPYWYSISPKSAHISMAINPYERLFFTYANEPFIMDQRMVALQVNEGYDVELVAALLNSAITLLTLELRGTARYLGALDLNADYLKTLKILDPDKLSKTSKDKILKAFNPLRKKPVKPILSELTTPERKEFDRTVLEAYGYDAALLKSIYSLLKSAVSERISMKTRK